MFDTTDDSPVPAPDRPSYAPLSDEDPHQVRQAELIDRVRTLAAGINVLEAQLCDAIAEIEDEGWSALWGSKSTPDFISYATGCSVTRARRQWRVAVAMSDMPTVAADMRKGGISVDQAHSIATVATPENEAVLARWARECTPAHLERICSSYKKALSPEEEAEVTWTRFVSYNFDDHNGFTIRARLSNEEGSIFARAMEAAWDQVPKESEYRDVDALVSIADSYLAGARDARPGGDRYCVTLHVDTDEDGLLVSQDGARFSDQALSRFLCDCSTVTILERNGKTIDIGRKSRTPNAAVRRAMEARDKGCRFPGCRNARGVDAHHIEMWSADGETKLLNLLSLCRFHHHLVHEGGYRVFLDPENQIRFHDTFGRLIPASLALERGDVPDLEVDATTCESGWDGEPPDYDLIVGTLINSS